MTEEEIQRFGTTEGIEINSIYEDVLGLFVYDEEIIVGHVRRFIKIVNKTENSVEYKECLGRNFRSWIEMKGWSWKIKAAEKEIDFNRAFINQEVKSEVIKEINDRIKQLNGIRFIKLKVEISKVV